MAEFVRSPAGLSTIAALSQRIIPVNSRGRVLNGASLTHAGRAATQPARVLCHVQEFTDDEPLAVFPGMLVGLARANGKQRLIFPRPGDEARFIMRL